MKEERQAAVEAILKAGHIPAGMELFAAGDASQLETIRRWIDESDAFMLILGGRYGSLEAESGKSYIELEYDYASSQGMPLFAAVMSDKALGCKRGTLDAEGVRLLEENGDKYTAFRARVLGKISRLYDDPKDVRLSVYETLGEFTQRKEFTGGWVSAREVAEPKPLLDEIARLREENEQLQRKLAAKPAADRLSGAEQLSELRDLTSKESVNIPKEHGGGKEGTVDLYSAFISTAEHFAGGQVTNSINNSKGMHFLYFNLAPKLALHGLVEQKKAPTGKYGQFYLTDLGKRVVANHKSMVAGKETPQALKDVEKAPVAKKPKRAPGKK
jgi:hypothetical protein